jgi:subtilisin family serine protease
VIAVAAIDRYGRLTGFSNFGRTSVDIGAPGEEIISTIPPKDYDFLSGTSQATPHVTGVSANVPAANRLKAFIQI